MAVYQKRVAEKCSIGPSQIKQALPVQSPLLLPSLKAEPELVCFLLSGVNSYEQSRVG